MHSNIPKDAAEASSKLPRHSGWLGIPKHGFVFVITTNIIEI